MTAPQLNREILAWPPGQEFMAFGIFSLRQRCVTVKLPASHCDFRAKQAVCSHARQSRGVMSQIRFIDETSFLNSKFYLNPQIQPAIGDENAQASHCHAIVRSNHHGGKNRLTDVRTRH
jgi:hypothetical protein